MKKRKVAIADFKILPKAKKYINKILDSNRLSPGPYTEKFENDFAKIHGRKYAVFVNSGTSALQVALHALKEINGWDDNDEILVPAITFIATPNIIVHNKLKPVFVDVESDYYCIDPAKIEAKITKKTRAILPVHLFGQSADMEAILKIAKKHNLKILEDSAETMFVKYKGKPVGSLGDVACYSTNIAHIITTGTGGIVVTDDKNIHDTVKSLIFHGRNNIYLKPEDDDDTQNKEKVSALIEKRFQFVHVGYSFRPTEMEAALGLSQIEVKNTIVKNRQKVGKAITKALSEFSKFFTLASVRIQSEHIYMLYPIVIKDKRINKEELLMALEQNNIETRLFFPILSQPIYKKIVGDIEKNYPVAKMLVENGFIIGSHPYITTSDIKHVYSVFKNFLTKKGLI